MDRRPIADDRQADAADLAPEPDLALDPEDWDAFAKLCHEMVDQALGAVRQVRSGPVWRPMPDWAKEGLAEPLPLAAQGAAASSADYLRLIMPYTTGNQHPRFFGWVHGAGTPVGMLAEFLAASMNANLGGRDHGAVYVERQVIEWCRQIFKFPGGSSGLLVSGTSMATLIGLATARTAILGERVRSEGLTGMGLRPIAYASAQSHGSVAKALELLGIGEANLRLVPTDEKLRMRVDALSEAIRADRREGAVPFLVVGTAGTVNTGAIDPLAEIAAVCREEQLWFHVDGAFGALAILAPGFEKMLSGIEQADSLAFDFHKWMHVPYDAGCVLVRRADQHRAAFAHAQDYLASATRGLAGGEPWFCDYGPELSRGFRALKVWFTMKSHGLDRLGRNIERNCQLASYLARRVGEDPRLELMAPTDLNIVCFRFVGGLGSAEFLDRVNGEIVADLQESGVAAPSTTRLRGALAIRACICNHRTEASDIDILLKAVLERGLAQERDRAG